LLTFVHLSDIHFSPRDPGSPHELDEELRNELQLDVVTKARELGGASAILVSGDVAFSGDPREYAKAAEWLSVLCNELQLAPESVWTVPGNHDVQRGALRGDVTRRALRAHLRALSREPLNRKLEEALNDDAGAAALA